MNWPVRLNRSKWWRGFWLCWFTGFGCWDLVAGLWPFALAMAVLLTTNVGLWMLIDRNVANL